MVHKIQTSLDVHLDLSGVVGKHCKRLHDSFTSIVRDASFMFCACSPNAIFIDIMAMGEYCAYNRWYLHFDKRNHC